MCSCERLIQFSISPKTGIFHPVLEVILTQILAYVLAEFQGIDPDSVRYISKVINTEIGIPAENR